jgi:hypothetical protein
MSEGDALLYRMPSLEDTRTVRKTEIKEELEEIQRKAYEEGFTAGEKAGLQEGTQKSDVIIGSPRKIVEEIVSFREKFVQDLEGQVVDLATAMARKIITEEIATRPEVIVSVVREALKKLQRTGTITIKINPALYELFTKKKHELIGLHEDIFFDVNPNIALTAPLVISGTEEVVADIDALIVNIMEEMKRVKVQKLENAAEEAEGGLDEGIPGVGQRVITDEEEQFPC